MSHLTLQSSGNGSPLGINGQKAKEKGKEKKNKKVVSEKKKNVPWSNSYLRHHKATSPTNSKDKVPQLRNENLFLLWTFCPKTSAEAL